MRRVAALVAMLVSLPRAAAAQDVAVSEVTLAELYAMAPSSPRMRAAEALGEAGLGDVTAAGTPPNPELAYDAFGLLWGEQTNGGSQHQVTISQVFPWPGELDARVRAARAALEAGRSLVALARSLLELDVRRAYVALLAAQERAALLEESRAALDELTSIVRGRAASGAGRAWDVVRLEAELAALESAAVGAAADEALAAGALAVLLGRAGWTPRAVGRLADLPPPPDALASPEHHPRVEAARLLAEAADAALERERALAFPRFELRLGHVATTWPEGGYLFGGFSIPLPFFDQNQGAIERAEHEREAAHETEAAVRLELDAERAAARRALTLRAAALAEFDASVLERLTSSVEMARTAYRGGEIPIFELLDAVRAARTMSVERVGIEAAYQAAVVDLLEAALVGAP